MEHCKREGKKHILSCDSYVYDSGGTQSESKILSNHRIVKYAPVYNLVLNFRSTKCNLKTSSCGN